MKEIIFDFTQMQTRQAAHAYIKKTLQFPDYYGENLDALYDCLGEISEATTLWIPRSLIDSLGEYGQTMLTVFEEAAAHNEKLTIKLK